MEVLQYARNLLTLRKLFPWVLLIVLLFRFPPLSV